MKQTRQQLLDRLAVLEEFFANKLLANLKAKYIAECEKTKVLHKLLGEETVEKQHWQDCAGKLIKENEMLLKGVLPRVDLLKLNKKPAPLLDEPAPFPKIFPLPSLPVAKKPWWKIW